MHLDSGQGRPTRKARAAENMGINVRTTLSLLTLLDANVDETLAYYRWHMRKTHSRWQMVYYRVHAIKTDEITELK